MPNGLENKIEDVLQYVANAMGSAWNQLQPESQIGIVTSEACYQSFSEVAARFDFSAAIVPIMKSLELELKIHFFDGYMTYLKSHYTPEEYAHEVCHKGKVYPGDRQMASHKYKIVYYTGEALQYQNDISQFTIGNLSPTVSCYKFNGLLIDKPFLAYCSDVLFKGIDISRPEIVHWITDIIQNLPCDLRNRSAHAGEIQSKADAEEALDVLVKVKRLLALIVEPDWMVGKG